MHGTGGSSSQWFLGTLHGRYEGTKGVVRSDVGRRIGSSGSTLACSTGNVLCHLFCSFCAKQRLHSVVKSELDVQALYLN